MQDQGFNTQGIAQSAQQNQFPSGPPGTVVEAVAGRAWMGYVPPVSPTKQDVDEAAAVAASTPVRYVLTIYKQGKPFYSIPLPNQPAYKHVTKQSGQSVRYTLGDDPIRELTKDRMWGISLGGLVGYSDRPYRQEGKVISVSGVAALLGFDAFLQQYQSIAQVDGSLYLAADKHAGLRDGTYLVFNDFDEGLAFRVEVVSFDWDRESATTRVMNAQWKLSMHAYKVEVGKKASSRVSKYDVNGQQPTQLGQKADWLDLKNPAQVLYAKTVANDAALAKLNPADPQLLALAQKAKNADDEHMFTQSGPLSMTDKVRRAVQACRQPFIRVRQAAENLRRTEAEVLNALKTPLYILADVVSACEQLKGALTDVRAFGFDFMSQSDGLSRRFQNLFISTDDLLRECTEKYGYRRGNPKALAFDILSAPLSAPGGTPSANLNSEKTASASVYIVQPGDTWSSISLDHYGTSTPWVYLANYNGAQDAYSLSNGAPLSPGTQVLLPGGSSQQGSVGSLFKADDLYGTDYQLDPHTGDFVLTSKSYVAYDGVNYTTVDPNQTDISLISGAGNFKQAITERLLTPRGEIPYLPDYGLFPLKPGDTVTPTKVAYFLSTLSSQMLQDPRVAAVQGTSVQINGDEIDVSMDVLGVAGGKVGVVTPLV